MEQTDTTERTASCACGGLRVRTRGAPATINSCTCLSCQRATGAPITYTAFWPEDAVAIEGEFRAWRETREAGRWLENRFCPTCGGGVACALEVLPGLVGVPVGCFGDPDFPPPQGIYWISRRPRWLVLPEGVPTMDTQ